MAVIDLEIGGMTCATCAGRVERKLNRLAGVEATVNFATETARVGFPDTLSVDDLIATVEATGYRASLAAPPEPSDGRRLYAAAALTVPLLAIAMIPVLHVAGWEWIAFALATPVVTWGAWPFHRAAAINLRHGAATMDTLISLGAIISFGWSIYALFAGADVYFEVGAALTTFQLAGRLIEARAKRRAGSALRALLDLGAKDAAVLRDGREVRTPIASVAVDDLFVVRPGEKIATDGIVVDGFGAIDTSVLTGESMPVDVIAGDPVIGATVNHGGRLTVRATRVGAQTQLAQMARLVTDAQSGKAEVQRIADRIASVFVPIVIGFAVAVFLAWLALGHGGAAAMTAAVAVLIVACPCALGLATPTALLVGTGRGAQLGILIKGAQALESTRRIDTVVLDKTGTVTTGVMSLVDVVAADVDAILRAAGAVDHASEHPIARAIAAAATDRFGTLPAVTGFEALPGLGARGTVDGDNVFVGRPGDIDLADDLRMALVDAASAGRTAVVVTVNGRAAGVLVIADSPKPDAATAVAALRDLGLRPILLTGDAGATARAVAAAVGIDEVIAEVMPADKVATIRRLQASGRTVAMVGDGVNDAPALATADLGIAMGTGTDAAIEASDLTLVRGELAGVPTAIRLSRATLATIRGNLFWAFAYNVAAIPLAAFGLVTPVLAAAAMALSSLFVVTNSLRLSRFARH
ncbi:MAG TPA: heavy metal translocating P-type ATPase [Micromonosporaceae bacterium]|jgi:Cu+-exporting ATPase